MPIAQKQMQRISIGIALQIQISTNVPGSLRPISAHVPTAVRTILSFVRQLPIGGHSRRDYGIFLIRFKSNDK